MLEHAFLGRFVVIRDNLQSRICASHFGITGQDDGFRCRIATGAGDNRHPFAGMLDRDANQFGVFIYIDRRRFASCSDNDESVRTFCNLPVHQATHAVEIDAAIGIHWSD